MKKIDRGIHLAAGCSEGEDDYVLEWDEENEKYYWRKLEESDYESVTCDQ